MLLDPFKFLNWFISSLCIHATDTLYNGLYYNGNLTPYTRARLPAGEGEDMYSACPEEVVHEPAMEEIR